MKTQGCKESAVERKSKQIRHRLYPLLNEVEAAKLLGLSVQTLRNWRSGRKGPPYLKLSPGPRGRVGYLLEDIHEYRYKRRIDPEVKYNGGRLKK
jgi:hypothetical protein